VLAAAEAAHDAQHTPAGIDGHHGVLAGQLAGPAQVGNALARPAPPRLHAAALCHRRQAKRLCGCAGGAAG
jgi:hypothetical protein